ncbi:hypothetical protein Pelo_1295 [Pelomyxa schiedti]|nr:hypothetical protein Pelo_1295 [Pelomyxa schiedti]
MSLENQGSSPNARTAARNLQSAAKMYHRVESYLTMSSTLHTHSAIDGGEIELGSDSDRDNDENEEEIEPEDDDDDDGNENENEEEEEGGDDIGEEDGELDLSDPSKLPEPHVVMRWWKRFLEVLKGLVAKGFDKTFQEVHEFVEKVNSTSGDIDSRLGSMVIEEQLSKILPRSERHLHRLTHAIERLNGIRAADASQQVRQDITAIQAGFSASARAVDFINRATHALSDYQQHVDNGSFEREVTRKARQRDRIVGAVTAARKDFDAAEHQASTAISAATHKTQTTTTATINAIEAAKAAKSAADSKNPNRH